MSLGSNPALSDIDTLALSVRDGESRRLIAEAIIAYRGGALRSALMSTWIAVAYDIVSKARELAGQGEAAPDAFVKEIDKAIDAKDKRKLQQIENELLTKANVDLQLLAPHEYAALARLQEDRHLCAHPAFIVEDALYQPSPELVRAHIVHALQNLLVHAPLQGKSAIARFDIDLMSASYPERGDDIGVFIRTKYLDRGKDALVINLLKAIVSAPFGAERRKYISRTRALASTLREISKAKTAIYDALMPNYVAQKVEHLADDVILKICPFLENDPRIWDWIKSSDRLRISRLIETADVETLKANYAFDAFNITPLSETLLSRFHGFDTATKISIIAEHPRSEFVPSGIEIFAGAVSYRHAEQLGRSIVLPLATRFTPEEIKDVLNAANDNGQIREAAGMPAILAQLFDQSISQLARSRPHWQAFIDEQIARTGTDGYYSYSAIQERLVRHS
jgi:hypothetical protein